MQKGNLSTATSIIVAAGMISLSILVSGGIVKLKGLTTNKVSPTAEASPAPAAAQATPPPTPTTGPVDASVGHLPLKGNKDAKVTVVEFADFRCPFCEKFYTDTEQQILKNYVDSGKVRLAYRHYAFLGPASTLAASASECANDQNKFWEMHDYLFKNQPSESDTSMYTADKLSVVAQGLGMDSAKFKSCLDTNKSSSNVSGDLSDGQKVGVTGTPSVLIGKSDGNQVKAATLIVGAQPYANFQSAIDAMLK